MRRLADKVPKRYAAVKECIYCGTSGSPLAREHIVPFALGGGWILPEASCSGCARITSAIERYCLREMLGTFRNAMGLPSRRRKDRPTSLAAKIRHDSGREEVVSLLPTDFPASLTLARLPPARALRGMPDDDSPVEGAEWWTWTRNTDAERIGLGEEMALVLNNRCNPTKFSQMLAKIGHGFAVATLGVGGFQPLALDLALGRTAHINYLVGAMLPPDSNEPAKHLHQLNLRIHDPSGMIVVNVRLFANLGAPTYHVLVGLREGGWIMPVVETVSGEHHLPV